MKTVKGFTLIEILIALTVFAIIAAITSSIVYYAFDTRERLKSQSEVLISTQLAISLIQQDTLQIIERPIRGNELRLFPAFIGQTRYLEFTRDGNINPKNLEKRSTLKRIALLCENQKLIRRTWVSLDPKDRNKYEDRILLNQLSDCFFNYLNKDLQVLPEWREQNVQPNQTKETLPKAIQFSLDTKNWGKASFLFIIPGGLYAPK
jgi:general secretion pathway protein J